MKNEDLRKYFHVGTLLIDHSASQNSHDFVIAKLPNFSLDKKLFLQIPLTNTSRPFEAFSFAAIEVKSKFHN